MAQQRSDLINHRRGTEETPYEQAALGFRNYWYPVFSSREVGKKPRGMVLLGDPVVFIRGQQDKRVYAVKDECPHRGSQPSTGRGCEFPGTNTITCPYHGWTFDLESGTCVAVLPEGPQSEVPGKLRIKTYPVQERQGIIWIWMGEMTPVPLEEDVPSHVLRSDTEVRVMNRVFRGNWRWHTENVVAGHAEMVHYRAPRMWFNKTFRPTLPPPPQLVQDVDGKGIFQPFNVRRTGAASASGPAPRSAEFPGLGTWRTLPWWREYLFSRLIPAKWLRSPFPKDGNWGVDGFLEMLPGVFRSPHPPAQLYYEWYVPVDESHYIYFQMNCWQKKGWSRDLRMNIRWYLWGKAMQMLFNNQDAAYVKQTSDYIDRTGNWQYLTRLSRNDDYHTLWRQYVNENARGVGYAWQNGRKQTLLPPLMSTLAGGSGEDGQS
jgi:phenylpropionate dioxygenase-like ring-hydroxylating dioxygenase large terminal subunit